MRVGCCCVKFTLGGFVLLAPAASQPFKSGCVLLQVQKVSPSASTGWRQRIGRFFYAHCFTTANIVYDVYFKKKTEILSSATASGAFKVPGKSLDSWI